MSENGVASNPNAFIGKPESPDDSDLAQALGPAKPAWDQLISEMAVQHDVTIQEWKCYSKKSGWALRLLRGKRAILYMAPCQGSFQVAFILGDKAVAAARSSRLSSAMLRLLDEAPKYMEGTGIRLQINSAKDLPTVRKLAVLKLNH